MFSNKKPYSAVTVAVENLTSWSHEADDLAGIPGLVEAITLQATGPAEAARSIRKKLKYGNVHQQIRALTLLDGLISNAGARFQRTFADEMLLERLRVCGSSDLSDPQVKNKCMELFRQWAVEYKNIRGLEQIAGLYKQLPRRKQMVTQEKSKVLKETENPFEGEDDEEETPAPATHARQTSLGQSSKSSKPSFAHIPLMSSHANDKKAKKDKKKKNAKTFNLEAEKGKMKEIIADSSIASTNLLNALRTVNREREQVSENENVQREFDVCKALRRQILRYIQLVPGDEYLGSLLNANDQLVEALMTFEQLDRSIDADSDSDDELATQQHMYKVMSEKGKENEAAQQLAGLSIGKRAPPPPRKPPRPVIPQPEEDEDDVEEEDENDPFADRNAVISTPSVQKREPVWREV
ncbi:vhs domain containing protein [Drepanopeziza brunnea f. sp. 'multigermtubi' MB_m1]|uniref:Vhs domain containing protein n=1 Tax=Marssonina brunnea f. sp. multigermtubi (strain MB_m1) TaxID=1072389 RepID=K1WD19_MARBU|nr:vhs domain containing protein [Drepanopeziza brunnea f. sp. 'multigermtubi' MB_m1]EKD15285.1 vhs domain containing protein [Drepanopeziza brunnea f. sp. 'multigermtubi' MB_m1]